MFDVKFQIQNKVNYDCNNEFMHMKQLVVIRKVIKLKEGQKCLCINAMPHK